MLLQYWNSSRPGSVLPSPGLREYSSSTQLRSMIAVRVGIERGLFQTGQ